MAGSNSTEGWVDVQKNTFTRWANSHLSKKRMEIDDLYEDLKDGLRLIALLQIVSRQPVAAKYNRNPKMRIQKLENLNLIFGFMAKNNMTITNIGSSDIVDGNSKLVLGLMWTIIKSYQVGEIAVDGVSGKDGLLLWVKRSLTDYPTVDVTNFTSSWANGMAFCALIHKHYPTVIDFDSLSPDNATENVTLAFNLMEAKFGIPQLLNVGDVAGNPKPDDKSIMTYVSLLFQEFASGVQKKKAITTICKAVAMAQRISECRTQYETSAPTLLAWYSEKCQAWTAPEPTASLKTVQAMLHQFNEYKRNERPEYEASFVELESVMGRWVASCKNNHRDIPKMHPSFDSIALLRKQLQEVEVQYETACRSHILQCQHTDATLNSVLLDLTKLEGWLDKVNQDFPEETDKPVTNSADAEEALESMRFFHEVEVGRYQQLLTRVEVAVETKLAGQTTAVDAIARVETTRATFAVTLTRMQTLQERMKDMLAHQHQVDAVVKAMRLTIKTLKNEIEMLDEKIDAHNVHAAVDDSSDQEAALTAMKDAFSADVAPLVEANVVSVYTAELESKRDTLVRAHRDTELQTLDAFARRVDRLIAKRDAKVAELDQAVTDAHRRVTLSVDFAKLATTMVEHAASISNQINAVDGSLDEQLAALVALDTTEMHTKDDPAHLCAIMDELEVVNESLESLRVFSNPHTTETIQSCRATFASLQQALMERQQELEKEIAMDKLGHITPAQLNEVQEVFNHFDLDKDGKLARDEFIMACKGLGFDMSEESCHDMFDKLDTDKSDEIDLREFSTFCADQLQSGSTQTDVLAAFEILARDMAITQDKLHEHFDATVLEYLLKHMPHMMPSKTEDSDDIAIPDKYDYNAFAAALFQ
ncbi:hypothetical protein H310_14158 [Aphanomyces invadans]|uniref:Uncharacterized protein n=1 Tax=Aphanomyces invadans TaxID=157072 RepID=A0A024TCR5_9STRA|nr:hypothetical protein H310_14158 [Aphanomyces invadans]ETV91147.1 hypothetical protein H310_14158 [Aphanomyces invadans]|eukprot:XP_008880178.1 hypothetical protein H310_14158 [Aphanomyces invadans]